MSEQDSAQDPLPALVAAVDLGSNSFHMIVARDHHGQLQVIDRLREPVRLAAGLDEERRIDPPAQQRALECLERFGQRLRQLEPRAVRAVGTNTLRRAHNAEAFIERAEAALGHAIEVVSGYEEARLIYLGVAYSLADEGQRRLVVDIGGGSTELIIGEGFEPRLMESLNIGCVSATDEYFADGVLSAKRWQRAQLAAAVELEPVARRFRQGGWERAVGASGTIQAVQRVVMEAGWSEAGITRPALHRLRDHLLGAGSADRLELKGLSAERRPVFAAGAAILLQVFEALGIERMDAAEGALREGVIHDLLGQGQHEHVRAVSIASLKSRYHVDEAQAARVGQCADALFEQVAEAWELDDAYLRQLLGWAAELHEIGLDISHSQYHKHGAYVIEHADMAGFSRDEQQVLACLVRAHRRKFPVNRLKQVPVRLSRAARRLAALLRLAVLLNRGRSSEPPSPPRVAVGNRRIRLEFPPGWLDEHPLLRADLEQEAEYLGAAGYQLEYA